MAKKKIAFIVEHCDIKGNYPFTRVAVLAKLLQQESVFVFAKTYNSNIVELFRDSSAAVALFDDFNEVKKKMRDLSPDLIIHDGKDMLYEQVEQLRPFCRSIVHFDDFGMGAALADCNVVALFDEAADLLKDNELSGSYAFAVDEALEKIAYSIQEDERKIDDALPHVVVCYEDGDSNNLTYRTLRHLTQLHIPLKISVAIDSDYKHAIDDLQMMVLSRRHTNIIKRPDALLHLMPQADLIICNANYTPYKVATAGIPCITVAQSERELGYAFPREMNGFIHIGLGRKMKQSIIQNAVMELLLHEQRRERAVNKQRALEIGTNNSVLQALLLDFAYERHHLARI